MLKFHAVRLFTVRSVQVFCRDVGTTAGAPVCFPSAIDVPVKLNDPREPDATINPGDIIMADADGIVCIPLDLAEKVAEMIPQLAEVDKLCGEDVLKGRSITETFKERRGRLRC
jgi:regulator of RNase E activity RraA